MDQSPQQYNWGALYRARAIPSPSALWMELARRNPRHTLVQGVIGGSVPLYCNPIVLFLLNWLMMLACLSFHVTYVSYPHAGLPLALFALSTASLLLGYVVSRMLLRRPGERSRSEGYVLDVTRMVHLNTLFCAAALLIILFNWATLGPPPAIGDPTSYLTYGRFRQVLFPLLTLVTVNASLDPSRMRRYFFAAFGLLGLAVYITRGLMVVTLLEAFFVFSLTTKMNRKKLYGLAICCVAFLITGATLIGNLRTAHALFLDFLQIREKYFDWPMASLWLTSYVSIPLSNLCWILDTSHYHGPTLAFLYPLLPSFAAPTDPHLAIHNDLRIIDGASTYLAVYALDFSYFGVYLANLLLGVGAGWLMERGLPRQILVSSIFLTCMSLICFSDMFSPLSTIIQVIIQSSVQRSCFRWERQGAFERRE
ncbi:MAG: O-antigen polymerase [Terracidiphilus sp.]